MAWVYLSALGRIRISAPVSAQMGTNDTKMGIEGQPEGGLHVNVSLPTSRVDVLHGFRQKRDLVNRSVSKKRRMTHTTTSRVPVGCPRTNGHA
ncbi:hypothetical protein PHPALM_30768 [Phytophthora palmivora]|uniref:Uncharacterized protein n=1 Tax=Phytophthora palmivora TaxID=4796 RepID=A0A2P4X4A8_9STRA|nr:hypothetical protein PHPALM_30768 [Phytophthora palmivora]